MSRTTGLLAHARLVTVTGPGGVGKTALAAAVAAAVRPPLADQVVWCVLVPLRPGEEVGDAIADALGFPSLDAACRGLGDLSRLVVLDNCEHVVDATAVAVRRLLTAGPELRVLATSREPLELPGEHVVVLEALTPDAAVALLTRRAEQAGADLSGADLSDLTALCERCDRLPLALELAASRLRTLPPAALLDQLDRRLDVLSRSRGSPARHLSLRATVTWSAQLLAADERRLLQRLSIFPCTFTLDAAAEIAADGEALTAADGVDRLVRQSLVVPEGAARASSAWEEAPRFRLLAGVRELAAEELAASGQETECRERWLDRLAAVARDLTERGTRSWDERLIRDLFVAAGDLALALRACLRYDSRPARAQALYIPAWGVVHHQQGERFARLGEALLERWPLGEGDSSADVAAVCAMAHLRVGRPARARALAGAVVEGEFGGVLAPVGARRVLGLVALHGGEFETALEWFESALRWCAALRLRPFESELLVCRAVALGQLRRAEEAVGVATAALRAAEGDRSVLVLPWAAALTGRLLLETDPARGRELLDRAAELTGELLDGLTTDNAGLVDRFRAVAELRHGSRSRAAAFLAPALRYFAGVGDQAEVWATLRWGAALLVGTHPALAGQLLASADLEPAAPLPGALEQEAIEAQRRLVGRQSLPVARLDVRRAVTTALAVLDEVAQQDGGGPAEPAVAAPPTRPAPARQAVFRRDGGIWTVGLDGREVQVPDAKGLHDLHTLLQRPGREVHALELMGAVVDEGGTGPQLDAVARAAYEERIRELQAELDEAEAAHDLGRAERATDEFDALVGQLSEALGLGGRDRRPGDTAERARQAVSWRIRAATKRIGQHHEPLARHLRGAVRTGTWCAYEPELSPRWDLGRG